MGETAWIPLKEETLGSMFADSLALLREGANAEESKDVIVHEFLTMGKSAAVLFVDGLADDISIQRYILEPCIRAEKPGGGKLELYIMRSVLPLASVTQTDSLTACITAILTGNAILIIDGIGGAFNIDVKGFEKRSLSPPINETVINGPQVAFTESLRENITLLRRYLCTPALISSESSVGNKIPKRVSVLYLDGIARQEVVEEVKRRIKGCNIDHVGSMGALEQLIEDRPFSMLPQSLYTERPDRAVSFLLEGQVLIILEGAPAVLAVPVGILQLFHAPDDTSLRWQYGSFLRVLRIIGVIVSLLMPGLFIALTLFHPEGISLALLTSVIETQSRVPLSLFTSLIVMLLVFSLINEAGTRVPGKVGGSLSIVSGLVLGQAAVDADLFSPLLIIVVAIAGLGIYAAPSYSFMLSLRIMQLLIVIMAGFDGYAGLMIGVFVLLMRVFGLTSMRFPYAAPYAPDRPANPDLMFRLPIWRQRLRGFIANPQHMDRTLGRMRAWEKPIDKEKER